MSKRPRLSVSPCSDSPDLPSSSVSSSDRSSKTDASERAPSSSSTDSDSEPHDTDTEDDSSADESEVKVEESFDGQSEANRNSARHQCAICAKSFTRSDCLMRHSRIHGGIKPYTCTWPDCGHRSADRDNLMKHIRVVHFKVPATRKDQLEMNGTVDTRKESDFIRREDQIPQGVSTKRKNISNLNLSNVKSGGESKLTKPKSAKAKSPKKKMGLPCYYNQFDICDSVFAREQNRRVHYRIHLCIHPFSCAYPGCADNYRAEDRTSVLWHIRKVHFGLRGKVHKQKALGGEDSRKAKAYLAVNKELLNPCLTKMPTD